MATITVRVADAKLAEFDSAIQRKQPIPTDEETGQPTMTAAQWRTELVRLYLQRLFTQGRGEQLAAEQDSNIDKEIVT